MLTAPVIQARFWSTNVVSTDWERLFLTSDGDPAAIKRALLQLARETGIAELGELDLEKSGTRTWKAVIVALVRMRLAENNQEDSRALSSRRQQFIDILKPVLGQWPAGQRPIPEFRVRTECAELEALRECGVSQLVDTVTSYAMNDKRLRDLDNSQLTCLDVRRQMPLIQLDLSKLVELRIPASLLNQQEQQQRLLKCNRLKKLTIDCNGDSIHFPIFESPVIRGSLTTLRFNEPGDFQPDIFQFRWDSLEQIEFSLSAEIRSFFVIEELASSCPNLKKISIDYDCFCSMGEQFDDSDAEFIIINPPDTYQVPRLTALDRFLSESVNSDELERLGIDLDICIYAKSGGAADFASLSPAARARVRQLQLRIGDTAFFPGGFSQLETLEIELENYDDLRADSQSEFNVDADFLKNLFACQSLKKLKINSFKLTKLVLLSADWPLPNLNELKCIVGDFDFRSGIINYLFDRTSDQLSAVLQALTRPQLQSLTLDLALNSKRKVSAEQSNAFASLNSEIFDLDCRVTDSQFIDLFSRSATGIRSLKLDCHWLDEWSKVEQILNLVVNYRLRTLTLMRAPSRFGELRSWHSIELPELEELSIQSRHQERIQTKLAHEFIMMPKLMRLRVFGCRAY